MNRLFLIPLFTTCVLMACDSKSNNIEPSSNSALDAILPRVDFDPQSYAGDTATYTDSSLTLLYPSEWVADYTIREIDVILLPQELLDPVWGSLDAGAKCSVASVYFADKTLQDVGAIYASSDDTVEYLTVNGHKASRTLTRANEESTYQVKRQIVQGEDNYFHTTWCMGVSDEAKQLVLDSIKLNN